MKPRLVLSWLDAGTILEKRLQVILSKVKEMETEIICLSNRESISGMGKFIKLRPSDTRGASYRSREPHSFIR